MKRIVSLIFTVVMLVFFSFSTSYADEIDLSSLSYKELEILEQQIIKEMISRPEYKEVIVPLGAYKVGEDIPAGKWTISGFDGSGIVYWGKSLDEFGVEIPGNNMIADFTHWGDGDSIDWDLVDGTYVVVAISPVKFSPFVPKSLGF